MKNNYTIFDNNFLKVLETSPWQEAIFLIQNDITRATFDFFRENKIYSVNLPVTTGAVTSPMGLGSDSLPVKVNMFGVETYLADSMQFHLEYLLRLSRGQGVHYLMPTFRGEATDNRHLAQFYHSESEICGNLDDVMLLVDQYIIYLSNYILKNRITDLKNVTDDITHIEKVASLKGRIPQITFTDAQELLSNDENYFKYSGEHDFYELTSMGEAALIEHYKGPVWVTHYPYKSVPFYQKKSKDGLFAENADLLMGIGETVGCGERCVSAEEVIENMKFLGVDSENYEWYIKMKEITPITTSGFGLGVERFILWLTNHTDIRDIQLISRENGQLVVP